MKDTQVMTVAEAVETNPNRPTEPGYCANCGRAPCLTPWFLDKYDPNGSGLFDLTAGTCAMVVNPVTLEIAVNRVLRDGDIQKLFPGLSPREIVTELVRVCPPYELDVP